MVRLLNDPTTCPHGNPIPGSNYEAPDTVALSDLGVGAEFTVSRIPEELEFAPGLLDFLEDAAVLPGRAGTDHRVRRPTARRRSRSTGTTSASARSPAPGSSSPTTPERLAAPSRRRRPVPPAPREARRCARW